MAPEVVARLPLTEDSKVMWENIWEMYGKLDQVKKISLIQALSEMKQGNLSVTACFNHLSALWNELEAAEEQLEWPKATLQQYRKSMRGRRQLDFF